MQDGFLVIDAQGRHAFVGGTPRVVAWLAGSPLLLADRQGVRPLRGLAEGDSPTWPRDRIMVIGGVRLSVHAASRAADGRIVATLGKRMVSASPKMFRVFHRVAAMADHDAPVLILGESGTGKELIARSIHGLGRAAAHPCVAVNMAALPSELAEAELFGWERGAFSGAVAARAGHFEAAEGGTLFLDEIGEASLALQAKLLRVLDQKVVQRLGTSRATAVSARIVAATNVDLRSAALRGNFRMDLLERLSCLVIRLPPLRERPEDIAVITQSGGEVDSVAGAVDPDAMKLLGAHPWPGNVRQLRNVLTRARLYGPPGVITVAAVQEALNDELSWGISGAGVTTRSEVIRASGMPRSTYYYRLKRGLL